MIAGSVARRGRATRSSSRPDDDRTQVRGGQHLGGVAETDDPVDKPALFGGDNPQARGAGRLPGLQRTGAERANHAPGEPRVNDHRHFHRGGLTTLGLLATWTGWPGSELPREEAHGFGQVESRRQLEGLRLPEDRRVLEAVDPEPTERFVGRGPVASDEVPGRELEREPIRLYFAAPAPVAEAHDRPVAHGLVERTESGQRRQDGDRREARFGDFSRRAELGHRVPACGAAELHRGDSEAQSLLLIRVEPKLGKVVVLRVNAVSELFLACQSLDADRDPERTKRSLVPFECLAACLLALGVAHHRRGDLAQGKWA